MSEVDDVAGSHVSTNPNINFVVYVPTRDQSPLIIYDESGEFLLPFLLFPYFILF